MTDKSRGFERQVADTVRLLGAWCVVLSVALALALALATWGLLSAQTAAHAASASAERVRVGLTSQTGNRARNVASWCNAIDTLDTTLVAYVQVFVQAGKHVPPLKLTRLDCKALERRTLASTKPHQ